MADVSADGGSSSSSIVATSDVSYDTDAKKALLNRRLKIALPIVLIIVVFCAIFFPVYYYTRKPAKKVNVSFGYAPLYTTYRKGRGNFEPWRVDPALYTHVLVAFMGIDANYRLIMPNIDTLAMEAIFRQYTALRDGCKPGDDCSNTWMNFESVAPKPNKDLKIILSVGGWGESEVIAGTKNSVFHPVLTDPTAMQMFTDSCVNFCDKYKFDGIDIDIEYPGLPNGKVDLKPENEKEVDGYPVLMKMLGEALRSKGRTLSTAVGLGESLKYSYKWEELVPAIDYFNLMAYDLHGRFDSFTGPNTPLYHDKTNDAPVNIADSVSYLIAEGVPAGKMVLGLAAYGRTFPFMTERNPPDPQSQTPYGLPFDNTATAEKCMISTADGCFPAAIAQTDRWNVMNFDKFSMVEQSQTAGSPLKADLSVCACGFFSVSNGTLSYYEILDLAQEQHVNIYVNDTTSTAYLYFTSGGVGLERDTGGDHAEKVDHGHLRQPRDHWIEVQVRPRAKHGRCHDMDDRRRRHEQRVPGEHRGDAVHAERQQCTRRARHDSTGAAND